MKRISLTASIVLGLVILFAFALVNCGGGGSSGNGFSSAGNGTVALYVADAPSDEYDTVVLFIKKVVLMPPADQPNRKNVTVFESSDAQGHPVDLLQYRFDDFLLSVNDSIPSGYYEKIRLMVTTVEATGGPCETNIKIPSGKVDLVFRDGVQVEPGKPLAIRLDVDVDKSFGLHVAGNSGMCIFRPVVFAEAASQHLFTRCPKPVKGTVESLIYENETISGFVLSLDRLRGAVDVVISPDTYILDEYGAPVEPTALLDQHVYLKGRVVQDGTIEALVVVMGDVLDLSGTAMSTVNDQSLFDMKPDPGQALVGENIPVNVAQALLMTGCDEITDVSAIVPWAKTDVIGKFDLDAGVLNAAAVMIGAPRIEGQLVSISEFGEGYNLEIMPLGSTVSETVFLADADAVTLGRKHGISIDLLQQLLTECDKTLFVSAKLLPNPDVLEAEQVSVKPDKVTGVVQSIDAQGIIEIEDDLGNTLRVQLLENAEIIHHSDNGDQPGTADDVAAGDRITAFGLYLCPNTEAIDFLAVVIIVQPHNVPVFHLPEIIYENDEVIMLPEGTYSQNLTVNGNNLSLTGNFVEGCSSPSWTELSGDVIINGNNARFENIKFSGNVAEYGNNAEFINCCF